MGLLGRALGKGIAAGARGVGDIMLMEHQNKLEMERQTQLEEMRAQILEDREKRLAELNKKDYGDVEHDEDTGLIFQREKNSNQIRAFGNSNTGRGGAGSDPAEQKLAEYYKKLYKEKGVDLSPDELVDIVKRGSESRTGQALKWAEARIKEQEYAENPKTFDELVEEGFKRIGELNSLENKHKPDNASDRSKPVSDFGEINPEADFMANKVLEQLNKPLKSEKKREYLNKFKTTYGKQAYDRYFSDVSF